MGDRRPKRAFIPGERIVKLYYCKRLDGFSYDRILGGDLERALFAVSRLSLIAQFQQLALSLN
jgi:hypothetical protein